ncbi:hypothetical protein CVT24_012036 [Panaeolus cyanescens]|uniref:UBC core domain-containing protein n=1 Tax=Panaeolus cyanescens TaxID=181874 RepID=A0A409VYJ9_9AGAR|nr:hypothetical protein CVT24_012036 [Panaeolus cyanescens]
MSRVELSNNRSNKLNRSASDILNQERPAAKRQKVDLSTPDDTDDDSLMKTTYDPLKNASLKGRKRFTADFADLKAASSAGFVASGLLLKKVRPGDDEGSVEISIEDSKGEPILNATLLISDTSEYPGSHSLFCYCPDGDLSAKIQRIVDELPDQPPSTVGETVQKLMASISRTMLTKPPVAKRQAESEDEEDEGEDSDAFDGFEDYDDIGAITAEPDSVMETLQQNFNEIVATDYRPGFIMLGGNDFVVSVSLPVIKLADSIPPRALMAWDRRLLSCTQHLTLLISGFRGHYPVLENDGSYSLNSQRLGVGLSFKVGLSHRYKPGTEQVQEVVRKHGLIIQDAEDEVRIQQELAAERARREMEWDPDVEEFPDDSMIEEIPEPVIDEGRFDRFSLSSSLESLMDQSFLKIVQLRRKFGLGWSGAETLLAEIEKSQGKDDEVFQQAASFVMKADREERELSRTTALPHDPLSGVGPEEPLNLPLTAFCYLVRRLSLCTRYCIVCHNKLSLDYEALKPYVCDSKLCSYQYYSLNRGPSLEYEIIHNPLTVDLLVSLAYSSASEGAMEDPLPIGMGLRVPPPSGAIAAPPVSNYAAHAAAQQQPQTPSLPRSPLVGEDGLCEFDSLDHPQMRSVIQQLISTLPSVEDMKKHLERKVKAGKSKPKLKDVDPNVSPAAWSILRWCVASCTAHIEAITDPAETVKGFESSFVQFKMTVGSPDAEAKFRDAIQKAVAKDKNAEKYPVLYAFHGSPLRNWHSIIRHGLWYKVVAHGRAYGDGVYLAKDASTSMGGYAAHGRSAWSKSSISPTNCMALAEVVNLPGEFVSTNPHYVIKDTHWIMCRYLLVKGLAADTVDLSAKMKAPVAAPTVPVVTLDPKHRTAVGGKVLEIPDPAYQIQNLLAARQSEAIYEEADAEDMSIFNRDQVKKDKAKATDSMEVDEDYIVPERKPAPSGPMVRPADDWKHDPEWVSNVVENLMLPPFESSPSASMAIQRELKSMLKEQDAAPSLRDLGWYMPPDLIGDNLYQWIVELHSLDPTLPIAQDMKARKLNSIIFEIRFPPTFPNSPPFFRIITPRFLPFIHGGGGHVTGGGSICMDLLTRDGWLPSYSISAVLMQIRLALSNLEPRPARLSQDWQRTYDVHESLAGYKRAAATHNWTLPPGLDRLVR